MKKILMSIHPEWCEKIFNGEKTIEVRKTRPKLEPPFEVYVYCTRSRLHLYKSPNNGEVFLDRINGYMGDDYDRYLTGKVIGTFVCDKVEKFTVGGLRSDDIEHQARLSYSEMINYFYKPEELDGKTVKWGFAWHISDLKIYDKPKELIFNKPCPIKWQNCPGCEFYSSYTGCCCNQIKRPPQSWCYVEV